MKSTRLPLLLLLVLLFAALPATAAVPNVAPAWTSEEFPVRGVDLVAVDGSGDAVFTAATILADDNSYDVVITARAANDGATLWSRRYTGPPGGSASPEGIGVSPDSSVLYLTASSAATPCWGCSEQYATLAMRTDTGETIWESLYDSGDAGQFDTPGDIAVSPDGGTVYIAGSPATVAYAAATGQQLWVSRYSETDGRRLRGESVAVAPDGITVIVTGGTHTHAAGHDITTVAVNAATGAKVWTTNYTGPLGRGSDVAVDMDVDPTGTMIFVTGRSQSGPPNSWDWVTVGYDLASGKRVWDQRADRSARMENPAGLAVAPDGTTVYVTGVYEDSDGWGSVWVTAAYAAADGAVRWRNSYTRPDQGTTTAYHLPRDIAVSPDGARVYVTGHSHSATSGVNALNVEFLTLAHDTRSGVALWEARHANAQGADADAQALAVNPDGSRIYVTGTLTDANSFSNVGSATLAYCAIPTAIAGNCLP